MAKIKFNVISVFSDSENSLYVEIAIGENEACVVKKMDSGLIYVLQTEDGKEVYDKELGCDSGIRLLTKSEIEAVFKFAKKVFL